MRMRGHAAMPAKTPVTCWETGKTYPSASAAACEMGLARANIYRAIRTGMAYGGYHWHRSDDPEPKAPKSPRSMRPVICWETGETYPSAAAAARAFGCSARNIQRAARIGCIAMGTHWYYADQPRPEESDFARKRGRPPIPVVCVETGVRYRSMTAAAASLGVRTSQVTNAVKTGRELCGYHWRVDQKN